ncbi:MAG: hypothetical protein MZV49_17450 [Rhodopseudomonas palustris]|nr:hypothetical protein [Rhodopseudomonas palustris]
MATTARHCSAPRRGRSSRGPDRRRRAGFSPTTLLCRWRCAASYCRGWRRRAATDALRFQKPWSALLSARRGQWRRSAWLTIAADASRARTLR